MGKIISLGGSVLVTEDSYKKRRKSYLQTFNHSTVRSRIKMESKCNPDKIESIILKDLIMCFLDELVLSQKHPPPLIDMLKYLKRKTSMTYLRISNEISLH